MLCQTAVEYLHIARNVETEGQHRAADIFSYLDFLSLNICKLQDSRIRERPFRRPSHKHIDASQEITSENLHLRIASRRNQTGNHFLSACL